MAALKGAGRIPVSQILNSDIKADEVNVGDVVTVKINGIWLKVIVLEPVFCRKD